MHSDSENLPFEHCAHTSESCALEVNIEEIWKIFFFQNETAVSDQIKTMTLMVYLPRIWTPFRDPRSDVARSGWKFEVGRQATSLALAATLRFERREMRTNTTSLSEPETRTKTRSKDVKITKLEDKQQNVKCKQTLNRIHGRQFVTCRSIVISVMAETTNRVNTEERERCVAIACRTRVRETFHLKKKNKNHCVHTWYRCIMDYWLILQRQLVVDGRIE